MLRIEIQTPDGLADSEKPGAALAKILRAIANDVEEGVNITPLEGCHWTTETHRYAQRVDGVLIGSVWELVK